MFLHISTGGKSGAGAKGGRELEIGEHLLALADRARLTNDAWQDFYRRAFTYEMPPAVRGLTGTEWLVEAAGFRATDDGGVAIWKEWARLAEHEAAEMAGIWDNPATYFHQIIESRRPGKRSLAAERKEYNEKVQKLRALTADSSRAWQTLSDACTVGAEMIETARAKKGTAR